MRSPSMCVIVPGSVHQLASIKYPVNYMTEYLDSNRKETYEVFDLPIDSLHARLVKIYPSLYNNQSTKDYEINQQNRRNIIAAIISDMNKQAIAKIEQQNDAKNQPKKHKNPIEKCIQNHINFFIGF